MYAPYLQIDGLIQRVTVYDDYNYTNAIEIYENYANRSDCLVESRKNMNNDTTVDYYARGRADQCKGNLLNYILNNYSSRRYAISIRSFICYESNFQNIDILLTIPLK